MSRHERQFLHILATVLQVSLFVKQICSLSGTPTPQLTLLQMVARLMHYVRARPYPYKMREHRIEVGAIRHDNAPLTPVHLQKCACE
jgi:hypothetical protein